MEIKNYPYILSVVEKEFPKFRKTVRKNFCLTTFALMQSNSCALPDIALQMTKINKNSHNTNLIRLSRFLKSAEFQIGDPEWRMFISFVINLCKERSFLKLGDLIPINIDYTSSTDQFLILTASIPFHKRGIPIYCSMRLYPKQKGTLSLKKIETAFIKELAHLLPKGYHYTIVADRGFGNQRFAQLCQKNNFDYILRIADDFTFKINKEKKRVKEIKEKVDFPLIKLTGQEWETRLVTSPKQALEENDWYLVTSFKKEEYEEIINWYEKRFGIEKMFQDEKSSGFDIEKSKITKYMRFKRLFFCILFAQVLLMFIGDYISDNVDEIKKKFHLHIEIISAFLLSQEELAKISFKK